MSLARETRPRPTPAGWWTPIWAMGLCLALGASAQGADALARIRARLGEPAVVRGQFEQRKHIANGMQPLISTGDFLAAKGRGVLWRTRTPLEDALRLTPAEIRHEGDGESRRVPTDRDAALQALSSTVFALLSADFSALQDAFRLVSRIEDAGGWQIVLYPLPGAPALYFKLIRLEGDMHVRRVEIQTTGGDRTDIRFHQVRTAEMLAPEEARLFE
jgi:hypothetical protein